MKVYLAAPFFTTEQLRTVESMEDMLRKAPDVQFYSPRADGIVLKDLPLEQRLVACNAVFQTNVDRLNWCHCVLALIDDRDPGTIWEMGYAHGKGKRIVTYTTQNFGLNVMLQSCVVAHVRNLSNLAYLFQCGLSEDVCEQFRKFNPDIT